MSKATSVSRPVKRKLQKWGFAGRVLSVHRLACNLIDDDRYIITLLTPSVGDGPFSIVVDTAFDGLSVGDPARANASQLIVGDLTLELEGASTWEPRPDWVRLRSAKERMADGFHVLDGWMLSAQGGGLVHITGADQDAEDEPSFMARLAQGRQAYNRLFIEGLRERKQDSLMEGARLLAGLGPGGTPAGDDFLVGAMAAIWLLGEKSDAPIIADTAASRTSVLSAAFLRAAGRGEFIALWHILFEALVAGDATRVKEAALRVESFGASSGADALEGFILAGRCLLVHDTTR